MFLGVVVWVLMLVLFLKSSGRTAACFCLLFLKKRKRWCSAQVVVLDLSDISSFISSFPPFPPFFLSTGQQNHHSSSHSYRIQDRVPVLVQQPSSLRSHWQTPQSFHHVPQTGRPRPSHVSFQPSDQSNPRTQTRLCKMFLAR